MTTASIVIPSYGGAQRLPRLLDALTQQTRADWEAIVVIDGDTDGSTEVVAKYASFPIRAIVFPGNRGRVAALNAGFAVATGDVLIRCDDDLQPAPDFVERHVMHHEATTCGVVGLCLNVLPDTPYARKYGREADRRHRLNAYATSGETLFRLWAGNCSVSRQTYELVGGYDPRYQAYGWEDIDFGFRLRQLGIPIVVDPDLETPHFAAATTTALRVQRALSSGAARRTFETLHAGSDARVGASDRSIWNWLVRSTAARLNSRSAVAAATALDQALPHLPERIAAKLVALLVEASSIATFQHSSGSHAQ